ncbi:phosphotransferase [Angustibacter aerolatus]
MLAALADAALPDLRPVQVGVPADAEPDFDVAVVTCSADRQWLVRAPRRTTSAATLDLEARLLPELARRLPVAVPAPVGHDGLREGGRCVVSRRLPGAPVDPASLAPGDPLAVHVGQVIGALHDVDPAVVEDAGAPAYDSEQYRTRRLADVDRAARTGQVPAPLLLRWERALEQVDRWRFLTTPVHGDLAGPNVRTDGQVVTGLVGWGDARVADPADDLAWICVGASAGVLDTVVEAYAMARSDAPDKHLLERAHLAGELALARWLLAGVAQDDAAVVDSATQALQDLAEATREPAAAGA